MPPTMSAYPYKDSQLSIAERVSDLLGRMTLAEKIAQMYSHWLILSPDGNHRIRTDAFAQAATTDDLKKKLKLGSGRSLARLARIRSIPKKGCVPLTPCKSFSSRKPGSASRPSLTRNVWWG